MDNARRLAFAWRDYRLLSDTIPLTAANIRTLACGYLKQADEIERLNTEADRVPFLEAKIERLQSKIKHCENCGGSWVDDGINSGCYCKR